MAQNYTVLNVGSGGDQILNLDMTSTFVNYPTSGGGKMELVGIYVGSGWSGQPQPLSLFNPLPVQIVSGMVLPISMVSGRILSGSVNVASYGSGTTISSGQWTNLQVDSQGNLKTTATLAATGLQISGSVSVTSGGFIPVWIASGTVTGITGTGGGQVSGAVIISGNVSVLGTVSITSGGIIPVWIASGTIAGGGGGGGGGQVSGIVGVSGSVLVTSGGFLPVWIASGTVTGLTGTGGGQVSGAVIVSGNVGITGTVSVASGGILPVSMVSGRILSGSINVASYSSGVILSSGQWNFLQVDALGNLKTVTIPGPGFSGGPAMFRAYSGLTNTGSGIQVQSGAGRIYGVSVLNIGSGGGFLKLYDSTNPPTVGTTIPLYDMWISGSRQYLFSFPAGGQGLQYNAGLWATLTGGFADSDTTNTSGLSGLVKAWFSFRSGF